MALWYDVSDLMHWHLPHLTGIQRSVVGILNGLNTLGMDLKLISFDSKNLTFRSVEINDLPVEVKQHINIADIVASDFTDLEIKNKKELLYLKRKTIKKNTIDLKFILGILFFLLGITTLILLLSR